MNNEQRYRELRKVSLITIAVNVVLTVLKLMIGILAKSTAVISDGVHSLSDIATTVMVMIGLKLSSKSADNEHPYGHQRIESLFSLGLGAALGATALYLGYEGASKIISGTVYMLSPLTFAVTLLSIVTKEWMFWYTKAKAEKYNSSSMMSDAWHHRTDSISSVAVLIGLGFAYFGINWADPAATIAVCLIILKAAFDIIKSAIDQLIDKSADAQTESQLREVVLRNKAVKSVHELRTRISNNVIFVDLTVVVDSRMTVEKSHHVAESVRDSIANCGMNVCDCMVHIHPNKRSNKITSSKH